MAGPNLSGQAKTADYVLGRGELYFGTIDTSTGKPTSWRFVGNSPDFKTTTNLETLKHKSSQSGVSTTDKEVTVSQDISLSFSLDEINFENLAVFFAGSQTTHTNVAVAGFTEFVMVADGNLAKGRWYDIVNSSGNRAYDIDTTKLTVKTNEGTPVTLAITTDYLVDTTMGRIFIVKTSTLAATAITAGKGLKVTLTADGTADSVYEVRGLDGTGNAIVAIKFILINPADSNAKTELQFHRVTVKSNGDLSLIGDQYTQMGFTGSAEANALASSASPTLTIRYPGTAV